jgi:acetyl esterase/lipase
MSNYSPVVFHNIIKRKLQVNGLLVERVKMKNNEHNVNIHYEYYSKRMKESGEATPFQYNHNEVKDSTPSKDGITTPIKPLFVFVHGGAWKTGNSREHYQTSFLSFLLENDIDVISCNYRKTTWPQPLKDVIATFEHIQETYNENNRTIIFCGASAGGHLTIMSYFYNFFSKPHPNHKMLLFYPAIDVFNQLQMRQPYIFNDINWAGNKIPPVTLLNFYFETFIVPRKKTQEKRGRRSRYPYVSPLELFDELPKEEWWSAWPSTFLAHGKQDAITLYSGSEYFIHCLRDRSTLLRREEVEKKYILYGVDGSHNFDIPGYPKTKELYDVILKWIHE